MDFNARIFAMVAFEVSHAHEHTSKHIFQSFQWIDTSLNTFNILARQLNLKAHDYGTCCLLTKILLLYWYTPCSIHSFIKCETQIQWNYFTSQSTLFLIQRGSVTFRNTVLHTKSPFLCSCRISPFVGLHYHNSQ
jgi:hypothetical protein